MSAILVIQPDASDPIGTAGDQLIANGFVLRTVRPYLGEVVPHELAADGLVVLGGEMGLEDLAAYPWLEDIMRLLRRAVALERPTLAICLGAQLLAAAQDGRVQPRTAGLEAGAVSLHLRATAQQDALLAGMPSSFRMITFHRDEILQLPPEASWLVEGAECPHQGFRVGAAAWGLQFHPEASSDAYRSWSRCVAEDVEATQCFERGYADVVRHSGAIAGVADRLFESFGRCVRQI